MFCFLNVVKLNFSPIIAHHFPSYKSRMTFGIMTETVKSFQERLSIPKRMPTFGFVAQEWSPTVSWHTKEFRYYQHTIDYIFWTKGNANNCNVVKKTTFVLLSWEGVLLFVPFWIMFYIKLMWIEFKALCIVSIVYCQSLVVSPHGCLQYFLLSSFFKMILLNSITYIYIILDSEACESNLPLNKSYSRSIYPKLLLLDKWFNVFNNC